MASVCWLVFFCDLFILTISSSTSLFFYSVLFFIFISSSSSNLRHDGNCHTRSPISDSCHSPAPAYLEKSSLSTCWSRRLCILFLFCPIESASLRNDKSLVCSTLFSSIFVMLTTSYSRRCRFENRRENHRHLTVV